MIDLESILIQHNSQLSSVETTVRGQIVALEEELIKIQAKREHNKELLEIVRNAKNSNPAEADSGVQG